MNIYETHLRRFLYEIKVTKAAILICNVYICVILDVKNQQSLRLSTLEPRNSPSRNKPKSLPPRALPLQAPTSELASGKWNRANSLTHGLI